MKPETIVDLVNVFSQFSPKALSTYEFIGANVVLPDSESLKIEAKMRRDQTTEG